MKLHFVSSQAPEAVQAAQKLKHAYGQHPAKAPMSSWHWAATG
jgi:hypothetical protein